MIDTGSEEWRRECEAREWIRLYKAYRKQHGAKETAIWWEKIKGDIAYKRGRPALETLIDDMNAQSSKNRSKPR